MESGNAGEAGAVAEGEVGETQIQFGGAEGLELGKMRIPVPLPGHLDPMTIEAMVVGKAANRGNQNVNVLLLSMPDSFEHMSSIVIRMPNGALSSLAGNIDPHHRVAVADLILVQKRVRAN